MNENNFQENDKVLDNQQLNINNNLNNQNFNMQYQPNSQLNNNLQQDNNFDVYKILSIILGIIGFGVAYFSGIIAIVSFIIGIVFGGIYKNKAKKNFPLIFNIVGIILDIILIVVSVLLVYNNMSKTRNYLDESINNSGLENVENNTQDINTPINSSFEVGKWECKSKALNSSEESQDYIVSINLNSNYTFEFKDLIDNGYADGDYNLGSLIKEQNNVKYYSFIFYINNITKNNLLSGKYQLAKLSDRQFLLINESNLNNILSCYKQ